MTEQKYGETVSSMSGAYALDALTPEEREVFERHLLQDENLRAEVTEFKDTAAMLAMSVEPIEPPTGLRERLMAQIDQTAQVRRNEEGPQVQPAAAPVNQAKKVKDVPWWQLRLIRPAFGVAVGATAAVALFIGVSPVITSNPREPVSAVQALQADPNHETAHVSTVRGAMTVLWSDTTQHAAIQLGKNSIKLPNDSVYQLWLTDKTGTHAAGLITANNHMLQAFNGKIKKGTVLRMTVEPEGGSKQPTGDPLFVVTV